MAGLNVFEGTHGPVEWDYDAAADTLYVSFGPPRPAVGIDAGDGVVVRYDEAKRRVVGVTIVGIAGRVAGVVGEGEQRRV